MLVRAPDSWSKGCEFDFPQVIVPKVQVAGYTETRKHLWPNEVGVGWLCRCPGIVLELIRKRAHTKRSLKSMCSTDAQKVCICAVLQGALVGGRRHGQPKDAGETTSKSERPYPRQPQLLKICSSKKTLWGDLCWMVPHVSPTTKSVKGLNWTELIIAILCRHCC